MQALRIVLVAWRRLSRRSQGLAEKLGAEIKVFPQGPPYIKAYRETLFFLEESRPSIVLGQLPQGPLLWALLRLKDRVGYLLVADVHTGFLVHENIKSWVLNRPFRRMLRKADLTLIHNPLMEKLLPKGAKHLVLYDPPPPIPKHAGKRIGYKYLLVPAAWAPDEPLEYIVREYDSSSLREKGVKLIITGNNARRPRLSARLASVPGVMLTGFISDEEYYGMMKQALAVIAATTREYTMLSAAWEAMAYGKPLIASDTRTLRHMLGDAALYFDPNIRGSLREALSSLSGERLGEMAARSRRRGLELRKEFERQLEKLKIMLGLRPPT